MALISAFSPDLVYMHVVSMCKSMPMILPVCKVQCCAHDIGRVQGCAHDTACQQRYASDIMVSVQSCTHANIAHAQDCAREIFRVPIILLASKVMSTILLVCKAVRLYSDSKIVFERDCAHVY